MNCQHGVEAAWRLARIILVGRHERDLRVVRLVLPSGALSCAILLVNSRRETKMPEIYVHAVKGRTLDQKRALVKDITDAVVKNFSVPVEAVTVEIVEAEPTAKAKGGVLFSEMRR